jgi:hypothetical protein
LTAKIRVQYINSQIDKLKIVKNSQKIFIKFIEQILLSKNAWLLCLSFTSFLVRRCNWPLNRGAAAHSDGPSCGPAPERTHLWILAFSAWKKQIKLIKGAPTAILMFRLILKNSGIIHQLDWLVMGISTSGNSESNKNRRIQFGRIELIYKISILKGYKSL